MQMISFKNNDKQRSKFFDECDITSNPVYIRRMAMLVRDAITKGHDVLQLSSGNILITEIKVLTYQYVWNVEKGKFERAKYGSRSNKIGRGDDSLVEDDEEESGADEDSIMSDDMGEELV